MPFSDTSGQSGLIQHCERLTNLGNGGISSSEQLLKEFTAELNLAFDEVLPLIYANDVRWQWDDWNHIGLPIFVQDLVSGTGMYGIQRDEDEADLLEIDRVYILNTNGEYVLLPPAETKGVIDLALAENASRTGQPERYVKRGINAYLDPIPNYSADDGVKVLYRRTQSYFDPDQIDEDGDYDKVPAIPRFSHQLLSLIASRNWMEVHKPEETNLLTRVIDRIRNAKQDLADHLNRRSRDDKTVARPHIESSR